MNKTIITVMVLLITAFPVLNAATVTSLKIVTDEFTNFTEAGGKGLCFDIMRAIYGPKNIKINFEIMPYERAKKVAQDGKADIVVGLYPNEVKDLIYPKFHIYVDDISVVYLKSKGKWGGEDGLKNKNVAWMRGYGYNKFINVPMKFSEVDEHKSGLSMLDKGRIDFYLAPADDFDFELDKAKYSLVFVKWVKTYVCFANNAAGKELAKIWDEEFDKLLKSGKIKELFTKYDKVKFYQY